jgi:hypothetical protein
MKASLGKRGSFFHAQGIRSRGARRRPVRGGGRLWVACTLSGLPLLTDRQGGGRGWFGRERAMAGGPDVAIIGLVSHVAIVLVAAACSWRPRSASLSCAGSGS